MGATASVATKYTSEWTAEDVGNAVGALGTAFEPYKALAVNNAVDGRTLETITDADLEELGVATAAHRKNLLGKLVASKEANTAAAEAEPPRGNPKSLGDDVSRNIFISYARGEISTPFASLIKERFEAAGCNVWMDASDIGGGADFMSEIGSAIKASDGIVAVIDAKFTKSTYCSNELAMAQGNGLQIFPILFRGLGFEALPDGLQYMLASTNCIPFPDAAGDHENCLKMLEQVKELLGSSAKVLMRHNDSYRTTPAAAAAEVDTLAYVPLSVPDLPDVCLERPDVLQTMVSTLLGFLSSTAVSLSSAIVGRPRRVSVTVREGSQKLTAHGQGGVGKTTMAVMLVNHPMVRCSFDRIAWVSVGQTPDVMELQRTLFAQLTGKPMEATADGTLALQLEALKAACVGKRWLLVLDDVWERKHEKQLNCIDGNSLSKLLVTTRINGLLAGTDEISLNILNPAESVDLLRRTAGLEDAPDDAEANTALASLARLCGHLPIFLQVCSGMVSDYAGSTDWQTELVESLKDDRSGTLDEGEEEAGGVGGMVDRVVGASVVTLDPTAQMLFGLIGLCPEDCCVPVAVLQTIWASAAPEGDKTSSRVLRRSITKMRERNLLLGSLGDGANDGVFPHDIVRDCE